MPPPQEGPPREEWKGRTGKERETLPPWPRLDLDLEDSAPSQGWFKIPSPLSDEVGLGPTPPPPPPTPVQEKYGQSRGPYVSNVINLKTLDILFFWFAPILYLTKLSLPCNWVYIISSGLIFKGKARRRIHFILLR